jgi:shikimate kinase
MNITITGPRSVGKTTTAILLAEKIRMNYISGDELMDKILEPYGGLSKVLRDKRTDIIDKYAYYRCEQALKNDNTIFDLAGGALKTKDGEKIKTLLTKKSLVIGLLPSLNDIVSLDILYKRERERIHFKEMSDADLKEKVRRNYQEIKAHLKEITKNIIYTGAMNPSKIVDLCADSIKKK